MVEASRCPVDVGFLDPAINSDPFPTYARLLADKPIYFDPVVNFYILTRYEDIRRVLADPKTFSSEGWLDSAHDQVHSEHAQRMKDRFEANGADESSYEELLPDESVPWPGLSGICEPMVGSGSLISAASRLPVPIHATVPGIASASRTVGRWPVTSWWVRCTARSPRARNE